ncbi:accessory Sec system protein translocase subunit SecY2 [Lactococcus garvieae]|uniref:accessory Sec system protein translocase subunit SecY2 n=1 Tax=Lactococcus garvieae TaxID=1363 RepID=UPI0018D98687|nr:accessory Sec system protein translocase subunit SecY2 [Lactococcus garvieae]QPS71754.1 accessory Sec system protein translocase subunit SecY2 [Lactococcus garvieae]
MKISQASNFYKRSAIDRVFFSLFIILIYIIGSNIVLPGIDSTSLVNLLSNTPGLSLALSATGFSINRLSLFSLGLGPWMSTMILWRVLSVSKIFKLQTLTQRQSYQIKFFISLLLGIIQSLSIISQVKIFVSSDNYYFIEVVVILLCGLSVLIWLGNQNNERGIGGPTIIILVSMVRTWPSRVINAIPKTTDFGVLGIEIFFLVSILLIVSYLIFRFYQGERRLSKLHVMLDNQYAKQSYLPIPINPAGGMPFMYAFSIVLFPQYFVYLLRINNPNNKFISTIYKQIQLSQLTGILLLCVCVGVLSYGFAYVNVDYKEISENMKKSGDYFSGVYPGKNTEKYLFHKVSYMATISALCNSLIIGIPMVMSLYWKELSTWAYFIPTWFILMLLVYEIKVQFTSLYYRNNYQDVIRF